MKKISLKNSWSSITYSEFEELTQILAADIPEDYKVVNLLSILSGLTTAEIESLPIRKIQSLLPYLDFLKTPPQETKHKDVYEVNGRKYILQAYIPAITTAQYLDYSNYMKEDKDIIKLASCFLVPEGHEYNDGYNIEQVWLDINDMYFMDVKAIAFFLLNQYAALQLISIDSLKTSMKKMKIKKKQIKEAVAPLNNMVSSLLSSK